MKRDRTAVSHGYEDGEVTLGGRRVRVKAPRVCTADGESEVALRTYEHQFAERDQLEGVLLARMVPGVSTRQYRRARKPVLERVEVVAGRHQSWPCPRTFAQRTLDLLWN